MTESPSLSIAIGNYNHTRPIKKGLVHSDRISLELVEVPVIINAFRRMIRDLEFDISEMALSTYLCARNHGIPITALPIFLVRALHHGSIVVMTESDVKEPIDLQGKKVAVRAYTVTTGVWTRGILADEYGVNLDDITWVVNSDEHVPDYIQPPNVITLRPDNELRDLLISGQVDAAIGVPASPESGIVPLISDAEEKGLAMMTRTGVYPINHTLVVKDVHLKSKPWLAAELWSIFKASKVKGSSEDNFTTSPRDTDRVQKILSMGNDPLPYGLEVNRDTLETFIRYNVEQHIIPKRIDPETIFARCTLQLND